MLIELNEVQQMQIDLEISLEDMQKKVDRTHKRLTEIFTVWALEQQEMQGGKPATGYIAVLPEDNIAIESVTFLSGNAYRYRGHEIPTTFASAVDENGVMEEGDYMVLALGYEVTAKGNPSQRTSKTSYINVLNRTDQYRFCTTRMLNQLTHSEDWYETVNVHFQMSESKFYSMPFSVRKELMKKASDLNKKVEEKYKETA